MSEFNLAYEEGLHARGGQGGQVEWYQTGAGGYGGSDYSNDFRYDAGGQASSGFGATFEDEQSLLEELEIDILGIWKRALSILTFRLQRPELEELDLAGPIMFALVLASTHLLAGKLHFGVILGWTVAGSLAVWFVVNNLSTLESAEQKALGLYDCMCLLGYATLPVVAFSVLALLLPRGVVQNVLGGGAAVWAAATAAGLFGRRSPSLQEHTNLVAYPCLLLYTAFTLLTLYSRTGPRAGGKA